MGFRDERSSERKINIDVSLAPSSECEEKDSNLKEERKRKRGRCRMKRRGNSSKKIYKIKDEKEHKKKITRTITTTII